MTSFQVDKICRFDMKLFYVIRVTEREGIDIEIFVGMTVFRKTHLSWFQWHRAWLFVSLCCRQQFWNGVGPWHSFLWQQCACYICCAGCWRLPASWCWEMPTASQCGRHSSSWQIGRADVCLRGPWTLLLRRCCWSRVNRFQTLVSPCPTVRIFWQWRNWIWLSSGKQ